jgi:hypothetical protein
VALRLGLLTEVEVALVLEVQRRLDRPQRIGKILVARRMLTPEQVDRVLAAQALERGRVAEPEARAMMEQASEARLLGKLAVLRGLVTEGEVEECLFTQRQLAERGEIVAIGEVLVRKGYLRPEDLRGVLDLQADAAAAAVSLTPKLAVESREFDEVEEA